MEWKAHGEGRAGTVFAPQRHVTAQRPHQFARDAEPEPRSTELARARLIHLSKIVPDRLQIFFVWIPIPVSETSIRSISPSSTAESVTPPL